MAAQEGQGVVEHPCPPGCTHEWVDVVSIASAEDQELCLRGCGLRRKPRSEVHTVPRNPMTRKAGYGDGR